MDSSKELSDLCMEIENDPKLEEWLTNIEATKSTRISYIFFMQIFCECINKTPTELIQESIKEIKHGLLPAERNVSGYIAKFKKCMIEKGYAPKSSHIGISALSSFYKSFDIPLPNSAVKTKRAKSRRENNYFPTRDDINKLVINAPNLREKAIILCMATSGMGRQEIINLKVEDIQIDADNMGTVGLMYGGYRREKAQVDFVTFISPEAVHALKAYWDERNRIASKKESTTVEELKKSNIAHAEKVAANRKRIANNLRVTPDSFAFVTYERGDKLSESHFEGIFHSMAEKLGYDDGEGYIKTRSHALRKYFASTLEDNGFPKPKVDFMLGHTVSDIDKAYFNRDRSKLKELYKKYLPYITFEKTIEVRSLDSEDSKKLNILEEDNIKLREEIGVLNNYNRELGKHIDEQNKKIEHMYDMINTLIKQPEMEKRFTKPTSTP